MKKGYQRANMSHKTITSQNKKWQKRVEMHAMSLGKMFALDVTAPDAGLPCKSFT